eukprot:scaffold735_cov376-Prasinococcus_capsulatus_cf.AAC.27
MARVILDKERHKSAQGGEEYALATSPSNSHSCRDVGSRARTCLQRHSWSWAHCAPSGRRTRGMRAWSRWPLATPSAPSAAPRAPA